MKKILLAATLILAAAASSATGLSVSYDYDRVNDGQNGLGTQQELSISVPFTTRYGTFDGTIATRELTNLRRDNTAGFEVGYANSLTVSGVKLLGRAALGRQNLIDLGGGGFTGNAKYYSLSVEASKPITSTVTAFAGVRHRNGLNSDTPSSSNRLSAGVDYLIHKDITARAGVTHTRQTGLVMNGVTTSLSYTF